MLDAMIKYKQFAVDFLFDGLLFFDSFFTRHGLFCDIVFIGWMLLLVHV